MNEGKTRPYNSSRGNELVRARTMWAFPVAGVRRDLRRQKPRPGEISRPEPAKSRYVTGLRSGSFSPFLRRERTKSVLGRVAALSWQ